MVKKEIKSQLLPQAKAELINTKEKSFNYV
jgi:hypothetical protein